MRNSFLSRKLGLLRRQTAGNVTMMFAFTTPLLALAAAAAIDYTNATIVKTKLNAAADAASLAALTPDMLQKTDDVARAAATAMFNARAAGVTSLVSANTVVTVTITHPGGNALKRNVRVDYSAQSSTIFSGILHHSEMDIGGYATAQAAIPPNIDFYLLLDNSPSMALPATQAGLDLMQNLTPTQDNGNKCAFACHQASTNNGDTIGNPCADGTTPTLPGTVNGQTVANQYCDTTQGHNQIDNFALARKNNIKLRLDELTTGVSTLMQTADGYRTSGIYSSPPTYRFAAYSMDTLWSIPTTNNLLMSQTTDFVNGWSSASANFGVLQYFSNDNGCGNSACTTGGGPADVATNYDNAMSDIYAKMPQPGNGTNQSGDKPKGIFFFVTDGVEDESSAGARIIQTLNGGASTNYCDLIKARGIKIAVLYTEYLPVPTNGYYNWKVAPFQNDIAPALQACASPGLFYDAAIGADLGVALKTLFQAAVQSASLQN